MHVGTYVLLADPCYACMAMVRSTSSCMPINGSRLALLWSSYFNVSEKLRRAAGQRGGPDDLQDLDHLGHGRPVGRDLRRAHHAQLQHRQRLLLRELAAQRRVHQSLRRGVVVPTAPLLQRHTHLVCQHGHVVLPVLHRAPPRHQLQHQHAEPVHVALLVHPQAAARQLRRRVPHGRALHEPAAAHRAHAAVAVRLLLLLLRLPEQPRQPEVGDQRVAPRVQQDVARLQVVVDHRRPERLVQVGQAPRRAGHHPEPLRPRQRRERRAAVLAVEPRLQAAVRRVVGDEELQLRRPVVALERHQVGVPRLAQHARLAVELVAGLHHARRRQLLHGDHAALAHGRPVSRPKRAAAPDLRRLAQQRVRAAHEVLRAEARRGRSSGSGPWRALRERSRRRREGRRERPGRRAPERLLRARESDWRRGRRSRPRGRPEAEERARPSSARRSTRAVAGSHSTCGQPQGVASDSAHAARAPEGSVRAERNTTSPSTSSFTGSGSASA
ncbi:hypothetical protein CFC21_050303 [Triticum aestivum]|uniref:Uncharacterized protein n=2 Tax=Triticum aestivum TaxID=4565 RepID=A0A3B6H655_WHEAT|nr:hypothetical protein CFC21_050303 [Triticum aestivum]